MKSLQTYKAPYSLRKKKKIDPRKLNRNPEPYSLSISRAHCTLVRHLFKCEAGIARAQATSGGAPREPRSLHYLHGPPRATLGG